MRVPLDQDSGSRAAALPFCHLALRAPKPAPEGYPAQPETLGEHLPKARLDERLLQREVANKIGVNPSTILNWEQGHTSPALRHWPAVIDFLGFVPFGGGESLGERIRAWRTIHGVPRDELAARLGVDPSTVRRWESGELRPSAEHRQLLKVLLASLSSPDPKRKP
jgi:transcriptional regulator with XRE-family HTH domain